MTPCFSGAWKLAGAANDYPKALMNDALFIH